MESLLLSDPSYLGDFDEILKTIFNGTNLAKQPKYLIEIGCRDGFSLKYRSGRNSRRVGRVSIKCPMQNH